MSLPLIVTSVVFSAVLAFFFVQREAKRFALAPPTPLIDMDRMYDVVFEKLDEQTGSSVTPGDLKVILDKFVDYLLSNGLVRENIVESGTQTRDVTLDASQISTYIVQGTDNLDVEKNAIINIVEYSIAYLNDIRAVS